MDHYLFIAQQNWNDGGFYLHAQFTEEVLQEMIQHIGSAEYYEFGKMYCML